jgi:transcription elongation factor Elf1
MALLWAEKRIVKMKVWLDVAVLRCPNCEHHYVDASWYVVEMESDIECGKCGTTFNSKKNATDRAMLEFQINEDGKMQRVEITEQLKLE